MSSPEKDRFLWRSPIAARLLLGTSLLLALLSALRQSRLKNIWFDEAFTVVWLRAPWADFWTTTRRDSGNGVAYVLLLRLLDWATPGPSSNLVVFELATILAWLALIFVVYRCFSVQGHPLWGGATCLSMVLTTSYQVMATELRPYPFAALVVATLVLFSLDRARLRQRVWLVVLLLLVAPFIHPLLIPLVLYFGVTMATKVTSKWRWSLPLAGLASSATLVALARSNPRGDTQLFWLPKGSLRGVLQELTTWLDLNSVVSSFPSIGGTPGRLAPIVFVGWCLRSSGVYRMPSPTRTLLFNALLPLALHVAIVSLRSIVGPHDYISQAYRYLYMVLPLWTIVSSCVLLSMLTLLRGLIRERRQNRSLEGPGRRWIGSRAFALFVVVSIVGLGVGVTVVSATGRRMKSTVSSVFWSDPPNIRDYLVGDLVSFLPTLPELNRPNQRVGLTADDFSIITLSAAERVDRLRFPVGVVLREPFDSCVPSDSGLAGAPSVRVNAPVSIWGDVFTSSGPPVDLWIVLNPDACVDERVRALRGPKVLLTYVKTTRTFTVVRMAG